MIRTRPSPATFTNIGQPFVDPDLQSRRTMTTQQALAARTLAFDTGDSFVVDAEHCRANTFGCGHSNAAGRSRARARNDTPDGAVH
jgi:hypothetical protein